MKKIFFAVLVSVFFAACSKETAAPDYIKAVIVSSYNGQTVKDSGVRASIGRLNTGYGNAHAFGGSGAAWYGNSNNTISHIAAGETYTFFVGTLTFGGVKMPGSADMAITITKTYADPNHPDVSLYDGTFTVRQQDSIIATGQITGGDLTGY